MKVKRKEKEEAADRFRKKLSSLGLELCRRKVEILQVNLGKLCNQACLHCHAEAGPAKVRENMNRDTAEAVVRFMDRMKVQKLDLTGGAPEMNPNFRMLVTEAKKRNLQILNRSNLTVFCLPGLEDLPGFLAENRVAIVASLPCYLKGNVDQQRGRGTFEQSVQALKALNELGYGREGSGLLLYLVYNPVGAYLPPAQCQLEKDYKDRLLSDFGIVFNRLFAITNVPINRYEKYLRQSHQYKNYVDLLIQSFNPSAVDGLMCRFTLSVGWDGRLYDCDFNQALEMAMGNGQKMSVFGTTLREIEDLGILTAEHCFACAAGSGSSCQGVLT